MVCGHGWSLAQGHGQNAKDYTSDDLKKHPEEVTALTHVMMQALE